LGGLNLIYGAGMIESGVTIDYATLVMDNDIARICKFILRGIPTNDATLMVDEIIEVGSEEDFLSRMSTLKLMREHQSKAGNIDRRVREEWQSCRVTLWPRSGPSS
jgi:trimethylamine--corrinoid protein Co-methyltransferase